VSGCTITPLFDALADFHQAHPGVEISLREDGSDRLVEQVWAGTVELALVGVAAAAPEGLDALPIVTDRLVAAVPPEHPLGGRSPVRLRDVVAEPIVCMPPGTGLRTVFDRACARQGRQPLMAAEASAPDAIADLAARGLGIGILSESMADRYRDRLVTKVIGDVDTPALLALVWRPAPGPAVGAFLTYARRTFAPLAGR